MKLFTACSAVEACWKSTEKGKFQIVVPFSEGGGSGANLLASPSAQTVEGRVRLSQWIDADVRDNVLRRKDDDL